MDKKLVMKRNKHTFITIVISIYFSFILLSILLALGEIYDPVKNIGEFQFYSGVFLFVLGFVIIGYRKRLYVENIETVKARRKRDRPIEFIAWTISVSGFLLFTTGLIILKLILELLTN